MMSMLLLILSLSVDRSSAYCDGPPATGCLNGLWNEKECKCECLPPFCPDSFLGQCAFVCNAENPWQNCVAGLDCPWWRNPLKAEFCSTGPEVPPGIWDIFHTREDCCRINYPFSVVCNPAVEDESSKTSSPTPYPTISIPNVSDEEKFPIELRVSGLPFDVSITVFREEIRDSIKRILLQLAERYTSLKILNVELENRRRMLSIPKPENKYVLPEQKSRRRVNVENEITGNPLARERAIQRDTFDIIFDVTVLRREGIQWGPIIVEYIKNNGESFIHDIRESTGIQNYGVGKSSSFGICVLTSTADAIAECTPLEGARPLSLEPTAIPEVYPTPQQDTFTPTTKPTKTSIYYYPSRPTTFTLQIPDAYDNPTSFSYDKSVFIPFASDTEDSGSRMLLWWEILLIIFAILVILCLFCTVIGYYCRSQRIERQNHINNVIAKSSNDSTASPKSDWSDDDSESEEQIPNELCAKNQGTILPTKEHVKVHQIASPPNQKPNLQPARPHPNIPASSLNKTDFERQIDFIIDDDISALPNRSLRDLRRVVSSSSAEHTKPDPSWYSTKCSRIKRRAMEPSVYSRRSNVGKDPSLYLDYGGAGEPMPEERTNDERMDPSMYSISERNCREAINPSVYTRRSNSEEVANHSGFEDSCPLNFIVDDDISALNGDLESVVREDPSMYSLFPIPSKTGGRYWQKRPELHYIVRSGDSAPSEGSDRFRDGDQSSLLSNQTFGTIPPSRAPISVRRIIDTIHEQDYDSEQGESRLGAGSDYFTTSSPSISRRARDPSYHNGDECFTLMYYEEEDGKSDSNSKVTDPSVSRRARDPSYHISGYHSQSIYLEDLEESKGSEPNYPVAAESKTFSSRSSRASNNISLSDNTTVKSRRSGKSRNPKPQKNKSMISMGSRVSAVSFATREGDYDDSHYDLRKDQVVYC